MRRWGIVSVGLVLALVPTPASGLHDDTVDSGARYGSDFPDPHVVYDAANHTYIAFATNTGGFTLPTLTAGNLDDWALQPDTFSPPRWAAPVVGDAELWAPSVHQLATGEWRAYSAIRERTTSTQNRYCISVAEGPGPAGPFVDSSDAPLTCGYGSAGAIDPWVFVDGSGVPWLLWKMEDHRSVVLADDDVHFPLPATLVEERAQLRDEGEEPPQRILRPAADAIWSQRLDPSGLAFHRPDEADPDEAPSWASVLLTAQATTWERSIVESPALFEAGGRLHLLYSGNRYQSHEYATGWATCDSPAGPCTRARSTPILTHDGTINGPGGASVFVDAAGDTRVAFHAWTAPHVSYRDGGRRLLHIEQLCVLPDASLSVGFPAGWSFCDVDPTTWFGPGITWMADEGVTTGVSEGRFVPERSLSRAEAVTFLWRWAGSPAPSASSPFTDVEAGRYYTQAARWAAEVGIIRGTTPTTFAPDAPIDRAQVVTILHRAHGEPDPGEGSSFADVPDDSFFSTATAWAAATGITTGRTPTEFRPFEQATRAQFATLLCRFSRLPGDDRVGTGSICPG
ncbi:MAG: family 43 glycosylhydrolase [Acidimicrobiales bacterium]